MFPWKSIFTVSQKSKRPLYLQLTDQFIHEISIGRIKSGQKLPGTRNLSSLLNVNRKTIIRVYEELTAQGWLDTKESSGSFIAQNLPILNSSHLHNSEFKQVRSTTFNPSNDINYIPEWVEHNSFKVTLNGGSPDPRLAPLDWIYKECKYYSTSSFSKKYLNYDHPSGLTELRSVLGQYLSHTRGLSATEENILITRGSQMGLYLSVNVLLKKGDIAVVGDSSYDAADWTITQSGGKLERVNIDHDGMNMGELEQICQRSKVQLVYITPHHHFPSTVTLSNSKRIQLLNLASKYDFYIIEDDYDFDFHYKSSPILPLASLDTNGRIIYIGSFSKIYAPSIRVGYAVASEKIISQMSRLRRIIDRQGDHLLQKVIAESIVGGELDRHLKKSLLIYRKRRNYLANKMADQFSEHLSFTLPEGGMAIWTKFNKVDLLKLKIVINRLGLSMDIDQELAKKYNSLRIGFASVNEPEIDTALEILQTGIKELSS